MTADRRTFGLLVGGALVVAACGTAPAVEVERSMDAVGELTRDRDVVIASSPATPRTSDDPVDESDSSAPVSSIAWGSCEGFGIPDDEELRTSRWECGRLDVPMDPSGVAAPEDVGVVSLALTRHPATGDRVGSLLINPGGPGGAGLPLVWNIRSAMPPDLLRSFDIVSWDPRGVGQSLPVIACPADLVPDDFGYIAGCVEETGPLSAYLAAPYSTADMESIRVALGEERLDYLGYSYGSVLGALYAERYPERVGAFVVDGVTDPDVGTPDGPFSDGFPTFADDGLPAALARFHELCAATSLCLGVADATAVDSAIDDITRGALDLPTVDHDGFPDRISPGMVDDHLRWSMSSAAEWELLGAALSDARRLDGSNLAAHIESTGLLTAPDGSDDADETEDPDAAEDGDDGADDGADDGSGDGAAPDNFEAANFLIYCADLGPLITEWRFCDAMPDADDPLTSISPVEVAQPILVIGTEYDPLTPGYHAPQFAERLGDAVWMIWDGVGHTAFPGWTSCIDDAVADHLLGRSIIESGLRCEFVDGLTDDESLADGLFGFDVRDGRPWLAGSLDAAGSVDVDRLDCVVAAIVPDDDADDRVVAELILGVSSEEATAALDAALDGC